MTRKTNSNTGFRVALVVFSVVMFVQAVWILLTETYRMNYVGLSVDGKTAVAGLSGKDRIKRAASLAIVRGDLWAETAFTYGGDKPTTEALTTLASALRYSPHRGDVWLLFAALADRNKSSGYNAGSLLKMSYYTAPNTIALVPLRLSLSLRAAGVLEDTELQDMVRRDISNILTRTTTLKPALVAAYRTALPEGKSLVEGVISETDPGYLGIVRAGYP